LSLAVDVFAIGVEPTKLTAWMVGFSSIASTATFVSVDDVEDARRPPGFFEHSARRRDALGSRSLGFG